MVVKKDLRTPQDLWPLSEDRVLRSLHENATMVQAANQEEWAADVRSCNCACETHMRKVINQRRHVRGGRMSEIILMNAKSTPSGK